MLPGNYSGRECSLSPCVFADTSSHHPAYPVPAPSVAICDDRVTRSTGLPDGDLPCGNQKSWSVRAMSWVRG